MLYEKFTEFVEYVVKNVADFLPSDCIGAEISTQEVQKHGNVLTALTIRKQGSNVAPAIYLDPYYVKYCTSEVDVLDLLKGIAKCYEENNKVDSLSMDWILDWKQAKDRLVSRLVNISNGVNDEYLSDCPIDNLTDDIGILYEIAIPELSNDGTAAVKVSYDLMEKWGIHQCDLAGIARKNLPILRPMEIATMEEVMESRIGIPMMPMETPILIVSNKRYSNGAIAVLYDGVEEKIRERLGDFILLPSSVHEMLAIPSSGTDPIALAEMISEVNKTVVLDEEQLSNVPYVLEHGKLRAIA